MKGKHEEEEGSHEGGGCDRMGEGVMRLVRISGEMKEEEGLKREERERKISIEG